MWLFLERCIKGFRKFKFIFSGILDLKELVRGRGMYD